MKKFLFIVTILLLITSGAYTDVFASQDQTYSQILEEVSFWAVNDPDPDANSPVILSITNLGLPVEYSLDKDHWEIFANPIIIDLSKIPLVISPGTSLVEIPTATKTMVYLRLVDGSLDGGFDYSGQLTFSGYDRVIYGVDAYNSLTINWNNTEATTITITTPQNYDNVAPVPIPAALWLLGAGVMAIIGIRRKSVA
jgi:hypothetical protein